MVETTSEDRVAILLALLGDDVSASVLGRLDASRRDEIRRRIETIGQDPPSEEQVDRIVDDFHRFLRFAQNNLAKVATLESAAGDDDDENENPSIVPFRISDDPLDDLNRLEAFQIAGAVQQEHARTIALVISQLDAEKASLTLKYLSPEQRAQVFLQLRHRPRGPEELMRQIARATVEKAGLITEDAVVIDEAGTDKRLAEILRSMDRTERNEIMQVVEQHDPDTAGRVKDRLYLFEDIVVIEDRSLQKLLSMIETQTLATAMANVDDAIVDKIMGNLPRRASEMLSEEMELLGKINQQQQKAAQKEIAAEIARLDQSGELEMQAT